MTDMEKLVALLDEWGVPYTTEEGEFETYGGQRIDGTTVQVGDSFGTGGRNHPGDEQKVAGYIGFYTLFTFNAEGQFVLMGAWE